MSRLLAIDPGCSESAYVILNDGKHIDARGKLPNSELLRLIRPNYVIGHAEAHFVTATECVIEMLAGSYGQAVGKETMDTAAFVGRCQEAWFTSHGTEAGLIYRKTAVTHVTGNPKANDSHVRQALVDRFGGDSVALAKSAKCKGCKGTGALRGLTCSHCGGPGSFGANGPLVGLGNDERAALCVAVAWSEGARSEK